ncbi:hypothetical protein V466_14330 [Pseudomonas mandelii PD30]|uniref:Fimbrial protein n=2 Tax=Pseudomonas TaxID=286 RepID=A0A059L1N6_9PSED|nr:hypothetical protein V466_14330 [Pseudomonas mandelii PD30]
MMKKQFEQGIRGLLLIGMLFADPARAVTHEITAVFRPDPNNPQVNKFKNTTPISSICRGHIPTQCERLGIFSLRDEAFRALASGPMPALAAGPDSRRAAMFKVPSEFRPVQVTHVGTGEVATVEVRIAGIGSHWRSPGVGVWAWPGVSWDRPWRAPPSPCVATGFFTADIKNANFFWVVPEGAGACTVTPGIEIPSLEYRTLEYAYELKTPKPLEMSTGQYVGSLTYTMVPGGDFDFGDIMIPVDSQMTFNFTLNVEHTLKVEVPPGGNRVELVPQGGWQAWLQRNRKPERLFRDQTFNLSASSRFKMRLECQYGDGGNTCMVYDLNSGGAVPVDIAVTLPNGMTDAAGQPVNRRRLLLDGSGTELFQPGHYVDRKPGTLHFEIARPAVEEMLTGSAKTYSGNVTVIWDSEI